MCDHGGGTGRHKGLAVLYIIFAPAGDAETGPTFSFLLLLAALWSARAKTHLFRAKTAKNSPAAGSQVFRMLSGFEPRLSVLGARVTIVLVSNLGIPT